LRTADWNSDHYPRLAVKPFLVLNDHIFMGCLKRARRAVVECTGTRNGERFRAV
jgi:hypothetical protein